MPRNSLLLTAGSSFAGTAFCNTVSCDGDLLRFTISVPFPHSDKHSKCHVAWKPLREGSKLAKGGAENSTQIIYFNSLLRRRYARPVGRGSRWTGRA